MRIRPDQRFPAARGPAVLAAAVLALAMAWSGPVSAQAPSGWKRGGRGADGSSAAERAAAAEFAPERREFYSNLGLLDLLSREAVASIVDSLKLQPGSSVTLLSRTPHEANWFVGNILGEVLADRGYQVRVVGWETSPATPAAPTPLPVPPRQARNGGEPVTGPGGGPMGAGETEPANPDSAKADGEQSPTDDLFGEDTPEGSGVSGDDAEKDESAGAEADSAAAGAEPAGSGQTPGEAPPADRPPAPATVPPLGSPAASDAARSGASPQTLPEGDVLDLRVVEFGVAYSDVGRKLLFGPTRFTRVGGVYLQVSTLRGPEGDLRQVLSSERHRVDRLSGSQRSLAEGASYPFRIPELRAPGLGRYVEPTVVVGIVGSLVYLFYANQNSK